MKLRDCPPADEPALIGVSGGRDSVALLHALIARGHRLTICHLDHALRAESRDDAIFVRELAGEWGCEAIVRRENVAARAKRTRQSIETAAREARFAFFAKVARTKGVRRLFLAHHADDQVETFLFNLLRGSGAAGLGGIRAVTARPGLEIVRPLLGVWRTDIDAYIARHDLQFREDASNADPRHSRNRMRHEILPALSTLFGRDVRAALLRSADILRDEDAFIGARPELEIASGEELAVKEIRGLPVALQRRVLLGWLRGRGVAEVGFGEVEAVRALLVGRVAKTNLPGGKHARRRAGRLFVE